MRDSLYHTMAQVEARHWWLAGRRAIIRSALSRASLPAGARILEVGCGSGGNLEMLSEFGEVHAVDTNPLALAYARQKNIATSAVLGSLPDAIPTYNAPFDLICLFDVLEHVELDLQSFVSVCRHLSPRGLVAITVPAHDWMWSRHDELHHHYRRYSRAILLGMTKAANLEISVLTYFNTLLMPIIMGVRAIERALPIDPALDLQVPIRPLNYCLTSILAFEQHLMRCGPLPTGVSLLMIAERHA